MSATGGAGARPSLGVLRLTSADRDAALASALRRRLPVDITARVGAIVAGHAGRRPDHPAIITDWAGLTSYRDLARQLEALARALVARGVTRGDMVAVCAYRSPELVAAFLALEAVGAVYLPVEPGWPPERSRQVLADSGPAVILVGPRVSRQTVDAVAGGRPVLDLAGLRVDGKPVRAADLVPGDEPRYVIYTSGTTGVPKGAVVEHRGMMNHLWAKVADLGLTAADRVGFTAPTGFDISIWQMLCPLLIGATVVIVDEPTVRFPRKMVRALGRHEVTVAEVVPTIAAELAREYGRDGAPASTLRWLLTTGEELRPALAAALLAALPDVALLNAYGPTECSDDVTHHRVTSDDTKGPRIPIGTPVANCALYLLVDKEGTWRAARPGETAQLFVGGVQVGRGYLRRPDITAQAFFHDELDSSSPTGRLYRTGDLVRLDNGVLSYLGRVDRQVKVGGVRVELDEVEAVLSRHKAVAECAVVLSGQTGRIDAFVVARDDARTKDLPQHAREWLPSAAVPSRWHLVDRLPRTANGKVDHRALTLVSARTDEADVHRLPEEGEGRP